MGPRVCGSVTALLLPLAFARATAFAPLQAPGLRSLRPARLASGGTAALSMQASKGGGGGQAARPPLFIYGSLMSSEVMHALLGRIPECQPGVLDGYHRFRIKDRPYPAIAPVKGGEEGNSVKGLIVCGLTEEEDAILDYFEDTEYTKREVPVKVLKEPHKIDHKGYIAQVTDALAEDSVVASAYVYAEQTENLYGTWEVERFLSSDVMEGYIDMAEGCGIDCREEMVAGTWPLK